MRADRLISIVMLLQTQERMTAGELSRELEVSPRTDISGYYRFECGRYTHLYRPWTGRGIALLESYRTSLTGMSEDEVKALFMMSIPEALIELGFGQKLKSAFLKLVVALPPRQQMVQMRTQQRIYLDTSPWISKNEPVPHIGIIQQAVWQDKLIRIVYEGSFDTQIEVEIEPLGLVAKLNNWYLVGRDRGYIRVIKIADILQVQILAQCFSRDDDFDLEIYWKDWCKTSQERKSVYEVQLKVAPELLTKLHFYLGEAVKYIISENIPVDDSGWRVVMIQFDNFFRARESILNFGSAAEVLGPKALRLSVVDFAKQIVDFYHIKSSV